MNAREDIKILLFQENWKIKEIAQEMTRITGKNYSGPNISQKLKRNTLKYEEARLIGEILGYDLKFVKK